MRVFLFIIFIIEHLMSLSFLFSELLPLNNKWLQPSFLNLHILEQFACILVGNKSTLGEALAKFFLLLLILHLDMSCHHDVHVLLHLFHSLFHSIKLIVLSFLVYIKVLDHFIH
jgi:hypothetical protein